MLHFIDFHTHSAYSRGTSEKLYNIRETVKVAKRKGVTVLGSGDILHQKWRLHVQTSLTLNETIDKVKILPTVEVDIGKIHTVIIFPEFKVVYDAYKILSKYGNLEVGRPVLHCTPMDMIYELITIDERIMFIPAHIWTSWFGVLGMRSGYNRIEEYYGDMSRYVYAIETGMSSNIIMNWRCSFLDKYFKFSSSDLHSPSSHRLGREATIFLSESDGFDYEEFWKYIRYGRDNKKKYDRIGTIEVPPEYGKYHLDGHRATRHENNIPYCTEYGTMCPICKKKLTIGVNHRIEDLATRPKGYIPMYPEYFSELLPLEELIAIYKGYTSPNPETFNIWKMMTKKIGTEYEILMVIDESELRRYVGEKFTKLIIANRKGNIKIEAGYDGQYGKIIGWTD